ALLEKGTYQAPDGTQVEIGVRQTYSEQHTCLYTPDQLKTLCAEAPSAQCETRIELVDATTQVAASRLAEEEGELVLLNFASARNPGGGFLNGARAQEEDLCRCSGLYPTLLTQMGYYEANRSYASTLYTDHMIYSPRVVFFRTKGRGPLLREPFESSVITAPAPNTGAFLQHPKSDVAQIKQTFVRRWRQVLSIAYAQGHRNVLLGAWGCGAFRNDPSMAVETCLSWLEEGGTFAGVFARIVFAIPATGKRSMENFLVFQKRLQGWV
ncbi:MAG: TIGR02452 family protein, partial [Myxococcota bacterium]